MPTPLAPAPPTEAVKAHPLLHLPNQRDTSFHHLLLLAGPSGPLVKGKPPGQPRGPTIRLALGLEVHLVPFSLHLLSPLLLGTH